jgi:EmrB/QacA subfamily drug resistance transporter
MVLAACVLASSMALVDGSALTVALPRLRADLASVQWILNGYALSLASLTLIGGALADIHGKVRMLGFGCILFALGSAACALAPSTAWLIAARVVQGIAAAVLTPASLALIGSTFPLDERNRAIGVWAAASSLTTAGGPVLGGWLTEAFGWPSIFWINPPLAIIVVGILARFAPEDHRVPQRFDVFGAAILAAALGALAWSLSQIGPAEPDAAASSVSNGTIAVIAGLGCAGLGGYVMWERTSRHPMTPPRLAENQAFLGLNIATLLLYTGLSIVLFQLPFDLIDRRGLPSTIAGMAFLPFTLGVGLLSRFFGGIADSTGPRALLIAGPIGAAAAYVWMGIAHQSGLIIGVIGPMALLGISFAVLVAPLTASVMSSVEREDEGLASGVNNAASRVAQLVGISLAAGVASFASGYQVGLMIAAAVSLSGVLVVAMMSRPTAMKSSRSRQG